eukprot:7256816-Prymnesium_polylepis.1
MSSEHDRYEGCCGKCLVRSRADELGDAARVGHEIARLPSRLRHGLSLMRRASQGEAIGIGGS